MKILITGATGFLGSHLLQVLLKEKLEIIVLKKSFSNTWRIQSLLNKVNCYNIDQIPLEKIIKEHHIDIIIHTATNYGRGQVNYKNIIDDNILYPIRILESSLNYYPNIRFINTDTFFSKPQFFSDYLPHYTLSKTQLLSWLKLFSEQVSIVNMRLEHVYGPADSHNKFIPRNKEKCYYIFLYIVGRIFVPQFVIL